MLEAALELYGGKAIINSINFEDGEEPADGAHDAGAQVRRGGDRADHRRDRAWPRRAEDKLRIARRLVDFACGRFGLPQSRPADRPADLHDLHRQRGRPQARPCGRWRRSSDIRAEFPELQIILGLSNISLRPQPRRPPRAQLGVPRPCACGAASPGPSCTPEDHAAAQDPGRGGPGGRGPDLRPPARGLRPAAGVHGAVRRPQGRRRRREGSGADTVEERLKQRIVDGDKQGLEADLDDGAADATRRSTSSTTSCSTA